MSYREVLGPDLIIIVLTMPRAERRERILRRHHGDEKSADLFDVRKIFFNFAFILSNMYFSTLRTEWKECWKMNQTLLR